MINSFSIDVHVGNDESYEGIGSLVSSKSLTVVADGIDNFYV